MADQGSGIVKWMKDEIEYLRRLFNHPRVPMWVKIFTGLTLGYIVSPIDFMPVNPLDDAAALAVLAIIHGVFIPPDVMNELQNQ